MLPSVRFNYASFFFFVLSTKPGIFLQKNIWENILQVGKSNIYTILCIKKDYDALHYRLGMWENVSSIISIKNFKIQKNV